MDEGPLNKRAGDWSFYDVRFRQEREYTHCSWAMLRPDLEAKAYHGTGIQSTLSGQQNDTLINPEGVLL